MVQRIIRPRDITAYTGYSRSHVYRLIAKDQFPAPLKLGEKAVGWTEEAISTWLASRQVTREAA